MFISQFVGCIPSCMNFTFLVFSTCFCKSLTGLCPVRRAVCKMPFRYVFCISCLACYSIFCYLLISQFLQNGHSVPHIQLKPYFTNQKPCHGLRRQLRASRWKPRLGPRPVRSGIYGSGTGFSIHTVKPPSIVPLCINFPHSFTLVPINLTPLKLFCSCYFLHLAFLSCGPFRSEGWKFYFDFPLSASFRQHSVRVPYSSASGIYV